MAAYNILEARNNLSRLITAVESGAEEVTITRRGKPVARIVPITGSADVVQPNRAIVDWLRANPLPPGAGRTRGEIDADLERERGTWD